MLVVSGFKKNVPLIGQLTYDNSCIIEFLANKFAIKDYRGNILAKRTKQVGFYAFDERHHATLYVSKGNKALQNIWYQRKGHP